MTEKLYIVIAKSKREDGKPLLLPVNGVTIEQVEDMMDKMAKTQPAMLLGKDEFSIMEVTEMAFVKSIPIEEPDVQAVLENFLDLMKTSEKLGRDYNKRR